MLPKKLSCLLLTLVLALVAACDDASTPTVPDGTTAADRSVVAQEFPTEQVRGWFGEASPEVLSLPRTVFVDHDEVTNRVVVGVERGAVAGDVERVMEALGVPSAAYEIRVTEPIHFMNSLRDAHRPTVGGLQIHFSSYLCTLGFNASHADGYSFITNSHCSDRQGKTDGTVYYQPLQSTESTPIGTEVDDPDYFRGQGCPRGNKCRYSDAARAAYASGVGGNAEIAQATGVNDGSITVSGTLDLTSQDDATTDFDAGTTLEKVGRTTGQTRGQVVGSCVDVGVSGSNLALLCQTLVENDGVQIVGSGDSGSPVYTSAGGTLVGLLWGGNSSGDLFVFSPLKNIQMELGTLDATVDGTGSGGGGGDGGTDDGGGGGGGNCPPGKQDHKNCSP